MDQLISGLKAAAFRRRVIWIAAVLAAVILPGICAADGLIVIENPPVYFWVVKNTI